MPELNPQGDSNQGAQPPVQPAAPIEPAQEPIVEPVQPIEPVESEVDKVLNSQEFADKFFAKYGDGVKTVVDNQVQKGMAQVLETINANSQTNPGNPVEVTPAEPEKVKTQTDLEQPKESAKDAEVEALKARIVQIESGGLESSIRNIPEIKQLSELNSSEAERFIVRAKAIAVANNISSSEVSRIFTEGSDIARDVNNQIAILSQGNVNVVNRPINKPLNTETTPQPDKWDKINQAFAGK